MVVDGSMLEEVGRGREGEEVPAEVGRGGKHYFIHARIIIIGEHSIRESSTLPMRNAINFITFGGIGFEYNIDPTLYLIHLSHSPSK